MATEVNPRGRDAVVVAVLDAAERLFAASGPAAVSLRDIAAEAGVSYSLINRHFGTKAALHGALLERYAARWGADESHHESFSAAVGALLGPSPRQGEYLRLLAWSLLDDPDGTAEHVRVSAMAELVDLAAPLGDDAGASSIEAAERAALTLALVFGWRFFGPFLSGVFDLDPRALDRIHHRLQAAVAERGPGIVDGVVA